MRNLLLAAWMTVIALLARGASLTDAPWVCPAELATVEAPLNGGVIIKSQEAVDLTPLTAVTNAIP